MMAMLHEKILPIPLRADLTVYIGVLPTDLTKAEAERLARVILAYAQPDT